MNNVEERTISIGDRKIVYKLEQKEVKNLNLRIHKNGGIYVSANKLVPPTQVDAFVANKSTYIFNTTARFEELAQYAPRPKQYVSGETFYAQGRGLRLNVSQNLKEMVYSDGIYIYLQIKNPDDYVKKQRMVTKYLDQQCRMIFGEVLSEIYPVFQKYGVTVPTLRIRKMETRWGSCLAKKGIITLNKRLLEAPRNCIEYVVMHELCHFVHPNHSKQFYGFLTMLMPDWKERKTALDKCAEYWL